jgi:predicted house-cleaning noncanonical NTP pyrophosphatase (MazG superfamily)
MFHDDPPIFIVIIALCIGGWLINNWIRAKHGYALEDEWGGKTERKDSGETQRLLAENRTLHEKLDAMQDRMIVLEKIVTDRGYSLAQEIEALRDQPQAEQGAGVPLGLANKERV